MAGVFPVFFPPIFGGCGNISLSHLMRHVILWRMLLLCSFNISKASIIRRFNRICNAAEQKTPVDFITYILLHSGLAYQPLDKWSKLAASSFREFSDILGFFKKCL